MNFEKLWYSYQPHITALSLRILAVVIIYIGGKIALRIIDSILDRLFKKTKIDTTVTRFLRNLIHVAVNVFVFLAILSKLGIETTSFVAILGAATLAIGFALQGSLANFSAGVLIMLFRPFKVGDVIEASGQIGVVDTIGILVCELTSPDNRHIIIPNGKIMADTIINYTSLGTRRIDLVVGVSYGANLQKAQQVMLDELKKNPKILEEPEPVVALSELADSSLNFVVRPWVNVADYWTVRAEVLVAIKDRLDAEGIEIPFPQRDVHLHQVK